MVNLIIFKAVGIDSSRNVAFFWFIQDLYKNSFALVYSFLKAKGLEKINFCVISFAAFYWSKSIISMGNFIKYSTSVKQVDI